MINGRTTRPARLVVVPPSNNTASSTSRTSWGKQGYAYLHHTEVGGLEREASERGVAAAERPRPADRVEEVRLGFRKLIVKVGQVKLVFDLGPAGEPIVRLSNPSGTLYGAAWRGVARGQPRTVRQRGNVSVHPRAPVRTGSAARIPYS